jgi:hypothetical protein
MMLQHVYRKKSVRIYRVIDCVARRGGQLCAMTG